MDIDRLSSGKINAEICSSRSKKVRDSKADFVIVELLKRCEEASYRGHTKIHFREDEFLCSDNSWWAIRDTLAYEGFVINKCLEVITESNNFIPIKYMEISWEHPNNPDEDIPF